LGGLSLLLCIHITSIALYQSLSCLNIEYGVLKKNKSRDLSTYHHRPPLKWPSLPRIPLHRINHISGLIPPMIWVYPFKIIQTESELCQTVIWLIHLYIIFIYLYKSSIPYYILLMIESPHLRYVIVKSPFFPGKSPRPWQSRHPKHRIAPWINWAFKGGIGWAFHLLHKPAFFGIIHHYPQWTALKGPKYFWGSILLQEESAAILAARGEEIVFWFTFAP
jgi:hypothetical protein